ncbi:MAG: DEAD/DEAH box helicase family protein [Rhodocyclales bacterium]|nr:DEAD/DEAH box helicase family protein [Rhodocyclales bacterium]
MIVLKDYQNRVLDSLREFFRSCASQGNPAAAFRHVQDLTGQKPINYLPVVGADLSPETPYICLRVPTGGGKTLLACHAAGVAARELLHAEEAIVLWLVPSTTILDQTADALRDPRHPYRRALELACGAVEVLTIDEALRLSRATTAGQTVVIVATLQSFRVEDTTGRRVYDQNGSFSEHIALAPASTLANLLPGPDGRPLPSLVNVLRMHRPIVIVDEAHNARTDLSFSTLGALRPSCIVEFTATPARTKHPSNVLHHVSAAELKAADMVKLPVRVITRHPSQRDQLLADAITLRADLERLAVEEAQETGEYLRPIILIQAESVDDCEPLRERLGRDFGIPAEQVKISTGKLDDLKSVPDVGSPTCPVRFIITVQKLREGWDCPFAYVLCSLRETRSATAIEQIVGRILRLPGATAKRHPDLNCAYAFSVSPSIVDVLAELRDALEKNGFSAAEAERILIPVPPGTLPLGLQPRAVTFAPEEIDLRAAAACAESIGGSVGIDRERSALIILTPLSTEDTERLTGALRTEEARGKLRAAVEMVRATERAFGASGEPRIPSPYELGLDFLVPRLSVREAQGLFEFEATHLLEHPWRLGEKDATLPESYDPRKRPTGAEGFVDVGDGGRVVTGIAEGPPSGFVAALHQQVMQFTHIDDWTLERLVTWLDREIEHQDIPYGESAEFLRKAARGLMTRCDLQNVGELALDRFRLRDELVTLIRRHREAERKAAFQTMLFPDAGLVVDPSQSVDFRVMTYEPSWLYEGGFQFRKHYFGPKPGELRERALQSGAAAEEFLCAQHIDGLAAVRFWVRNLSRKASSFRLQTSTDWFYPDFVCKLVDDRILAVEYKGMNLYDTTDAEEKRAVGAVWAARSGGRCLFVMPTSRDFSVIDAAIG